MNQYFILYILYDFHFNNLNLMIQELNNILDDNERVIVKVRLLSVVHRIEMTRVKKNLVVC